MSWVLAFVGFASLIILHEVGHFVAAKAVGMRVERFALFFPPLLLRKQIGETEYAIGALPLGGYVKITGMNPEEDLADDVKARAYFAQPAWKRIVVIAAGPAVNIVLAMVMLWGFYAFIGPTELTNRVERVTPDTPAAGVLKSGDRVLAVDGKRGDFEVIARAIASHKCAGEPVAGCRAADPAELLVERGGEQRTISVRPVYDARAERTLLGFRPGERRVVDGPAEAVGSTFDRTRFFAVETLKLPARVLDAEDRKEISGVVGSYEVTRQVIIFDFPLVLQVLALISLSLGLINLLPVLPFDGGHIALAGLEKLMGRRRSLLVMERTVVIGIVLGAGLFLLGLTNDINRLMGEGFGPPP
ncbi:MAG: site-2 protease family protein [Solirubrobacterales bacterium]|nr:site-2 protease family protein [Solirubrobacterales bacterium]